MNRLKSILAVFILIAICVQDFCAKGNLLIIGGGKRPQYLMEKFIELSGGLNSKICIIPMASDQPLETAKYQKNQLENLGAQNVFYIIGKHWDMNDKKVRDKLDDVSGIFFSGGDQNRLTEVLLNTKILKRIKEIYYSGGVIAGTSAGAAVMSKIMITGDELKNDSTARVLSIIQKGNIKTSEGFGFLDNCIIDQHFIKRKRHNRLISVVLENPKLIGIGIDESTAIIVNDELIFEVIGESQVFVYDASNSELKINSRKLHSASNFKMHLLLSGDKYDIDNRKIVK